MDGIIFIIGAVVICVFIGIGVAGNDFRNSYKCTATTIVDDKGVCLQYTLKEKQ